MGPTGPILPDMCHWLHYQPEWNSVHYTTNTSLSLAGESLPYCETQTVTVTPLTLNGPLSPDTSNITVINPGMCV